MGCDIHWILERRHQDGAWEATYSKYVALLLGASALVFLAARRADFSWLRPTRL